MKIIRRKWKPGEADNWTREDIVAIIVSPVCYALLMVGLALACLLSKAGFLILGLGVILTCFLHWVVEPKLKAVSEDYEKKQEEYKERLENIMRWKEHE